MVIPEESGYHPPARAIGCNDRQDLTGEQVYDETVRVAPKRLSVGWKPAGRWTTSSDPEYLRKSGAATVRPPV